MIRHWKQSKKKVLFLKTTGFGKKKNLVTINGEVKYYYCNFSGVGEERCPAELKISMRKKYQDFLLFRLDDHNHGEDDPPPTKLDPKALEKIAEYHKLGIKPAMISHHLREDKQIKSAPTKHQVNYNLV